MGGQWLCLGMFLLLLGGPATVNGDNLAEKCGAQIQKVTPCLNFVTGKAATPTKECCDSTTSIKESEPECLCYFIQQTHNGSPQVKSLGVQEAKLLQLPSACNMKNASVTNCPSNFSISLPTFIFYFVYLHFYSCDSIYFMLSQYDPDPDP